MLLKFIFIGGLTLLFFWSRTPSVQVGPNPPRGAHVEWRQYPVEGDTLTHAGRSIVLPRGAELWLPHWTKVRQEDWPPENDSLEVTTYDQPQR